MDIGLLEIYLLDFCWAGWGVFEFLLTELSVEARDQNRSLSLSTTP